MITNPRFTLRELQLVLELLEKEKHELPHEIHHTDARAMRRELECRLRDVDRLIERLRWDLAEELKSQAWNSKPTQQSVFAS